MNTSKLKITDISNDFLSNPFTGDVSVKKDIDAVKQSLRNLLLLNQFEKPFNPDISVNLKAFLFEKLPPNFIKNSINDQIRDIIEKYEPRAQFLSLDIGYSQDENYLQIDITFSLKNDNSQTPQSLTLNVERLR